MQRISGTIPMSVMITTKGRYAARLMLYLALNYGNGVSTIKDISSSIGVTPKYLESIVSSLSKAGLITSVRGSQGGH